LCFFNVPSPFFSQQDNVFAQAGVDFTNILQAALAHSDPKSSKNTEGLTVFLRFWDLRA
jgi:hypothetical protein